MTGDLRIGSMLGSYRIIALLGRGGMGVVYRAEHVHLDRAVALKVLGPDLGDDPSFRERFVGESKTAAGLEHPNVIPVYDAGEVDGTLFIAMRIVRGSDLAEVLRREGPLSTARTLAVLSAVAAALDEAHLHGLVHRDVKPANVLLEARDRGAEHVYLSDFGLSKRQDTSAHLTPSRSLVGTLAYVAPEQIQGEALDSRVDVYALACMLFECLTGSQPFPRDTDVAVMYAHLSDPPPAVTSARREVPTGIDAVVAGGMAKDPDERYPTPGHLMEAARIALAGDAAPAPQDIEAPPSPTRVRPTPPVGPPPAGSPRRRRRAIAGVAALIALVAAAGTGIFLANRGNPAGVSNGRIAFVESTSLVSVAPDGSGRVLLTTSGEREGDLVDRDPEWSADGTRIGFTRLSTIELGLSDIVVVDVAPDGIPGDSFVLTGQTIGRRAAWSPDGSQIAYLSQPAAIESLAEVLLQEATPGGSAETLAPQASRDQRPAWAPDLTTIAVTVGTPPRREIHLIGVEGGATSAVLGLPEADNTDPVFSPDGRRVAFVSDASGDREVVVGRVDGTGFETVSDGPGSDDSDPAWSPDGSRIAFVSDRDGDRNVFVVDLANREVVQLTRAPGTHVDPVWSPDGTELATVSTRDGDREIYVMDADGRNQVNVSNNPLDDVDPAWQAIPD